MYKTKRKNLNLQVKIALLGAVAFVLMFIDFPVLPAAPFLKIDFGDVPALLGTFALGPIAGIIIEAIKVILYTLFRGSASAMIGEVANFTIGAVWVLTAGFIYKRGKTKKNAILGLISGVIALTIFAVICNYYVFLPLYQNIVPSLDATTINYMLTIIIPFNLIKGVMASLITMALYKKISPLIHQEAMLAKRNAV